jgi:hypothetical protein
LSCLVFFQAASHEPKQVLSIGRVQPNTSNGGIRLKEIGTSTTLFGNCKPCREILF